jgi:peptidoglycan glycosyltransferase
VANGGQLMTPQLVQEVLADDLRLLSEFEPAVYSTPMSEATANELSRMMVAGVAQGVASAAQIPGVPVAGKTGTAETGIDEGRSFWFTGFAPATDPQIAVAVVVEGDSADGTGNSVAGPIARAVLEKGVAQ